MLGLSIGVYVSAMEDAVRSLWGAYMIIFGSLDCLGRVDAFVFNLSGQSSTKATNNHMCTYNNY